MLLACHGQLRLAPSGHVIGIDMDAALTLAAARATTSQCSRNCYPRPSSGWSRQGLAIEFAMTGLDQAQRYDFGGFRARCHPSACDTSLQQQKAPRGKAGGDAPRAALQLRMLSALYRLMSGKAAERTDAMPEEAQQGSQPAQAEPCEDYLARVQRIAATIEAEAEASERRLRLTPTLQAALHREGLFRLLLPRTFGGFETDPPIFFQVIEEVAKARRQHRLVPVPGETAVPCQPLA